MASSLTFGNQYLPPELLYNILTFIIPESNFEENINLCYYDIHRFIRKRQAVLHALCLTSRALYAHCVPSLYSRIHLIWVERSHVCQPILLLRTLLTRPDLAGLVRDIYIRRWNIESSFEVLVKAHFTLHELAIFKTAVSRVTRPQNYDIDYGQSEAVSAVSVQLMHGLRSIKLISDCETDLDDCHSLYFWEIMDLTLGDGDLRPRSAYAIPGEVAPARILPVLETLEITYGIPTGLMLSFSIPTLRNLKISTSRVAHFSDFLTRAPNLKSLELTLMSDMSARPQFNNTWVDADELHRLIIAAPCSHQLQRLTVEIYWFSGASANFVGFFSGHDWINNGCGIHGSLGPLTELRSLEILETSLSILLGWRPLSWRSADLASMLPATLKKLRLGHELFMVNRHLLWEEQAFMGLLEKLLSVRGKGAVVGKLEEVVVLDELRPENLDNPAAMWEPRFQDAEMLWLQSCCKRWSVKLLIEVRRDKSLRLFRRAFGL